MQDEIYAGLTERGKYFELDIGWVGRTKQHRFRLMVLRKG